jgi:hypothetical protein
LKDVVQIISSFVSYCLPQGRKKQEEPIKDIHPMRVRYGRSGGREEKKMEITERKRESDMEENPSRRWRENRKKQKAVEWRNRRNRKLK